MPKQEPANPLKTALRCCEALAKRFGGQTKDYAEIVTWFDAARDDCGYDPRYLMHRHHSFGIFEAEHVFGHAIYNSAGKMVPVRYIGEAKVKLMCDGVIPTVHDYCTQIKPSLWMSRGCLAVKAS